MTTPADEVVLLTAEWARRTIDKIRRFDEREDIDYPPSVGGLLADVSVALDALASDPPKAVVITAERLAELEADVERLRTDLAAARELLRRRLAKDGLNDCQVYWDYDAQKFLDAARSKEKHDD